MTVVVVLTFYIKYNISRIFGIYLLYTLAEELWNTHTQTRHEPPSYIGAVPFSFSLILVFSGPDRNPPEFALSNTSLSLQTGFGQNELHGH